MAKFQYSYHEGFSCSKNEHEYANWSMDTTMREYEDIEAVNNESKRILELILKEIEGLMIFEITERKNKKSVINYYIHGPGFIYTPSMNPEIEKPVLHPSSEDISSGHYPHMFGIRIYPFCVTRNNVVKAEFTISFCVFSDVWFIHDIDGKFDNRMGKDNGSKLRKIITRIIEILDIESHYFIPDTSVNQGFFIDCIDEYGPLLDIQEK